MPATVCAKPPSQMATTLQNSPSCQKLFTKSALEFTKARGVQGFKSNQSWHIIFAGGEAARHGQCDQSENLSPLRGRCERVFYFQKLTGISFAA